MAERRFENRLKKKRRSVYKYHFIAPNPSPLSGPGGRHLDGRFSEAGPRCRGRGSEGRGGRLRRRGPESAAWGGTGAQKRIGGRRYGQPDEADRGPVFITIPSWPYPKLLGVGQVNPLFPKIPKANNTQYRSSSSLGRFFPLPLCASSFSRIPCNGSIKFSHPTFFRDSMIFVISRTPMCLGGQGRRRKRLRGFWRYSRREFHVAISRNCVGDTSSHLEEP